MRFYRITLIWFYPITIQSGSHQENPASPLLLQKKHIDRVRERVGEGEREREIDRQRKTERKREEKKPGEKR